MKKGIFYVFIANLINLVISLITGFVLPKYLSIETYASIKLFQLYITYIGITHLGYSDGVYLRIGGNSLSNIDKKQIKEEFNTFKVFQLIVSLLLVTISIIINNNMLLFCSLVILPINVSNYIKNLYSAIGQFKKYSSYTNINTILIFIINLILLFIVKTDNNIIFIISYIVAYFIYWLFIEIEINKIFNEKSNIFNFKYIIQNIKSGFFLLIANFCNVIFTSIDRLFVKNFINMISFAYYSFATSIENLLNVFIAPINTVMYNYFCKNKDINKIIEIKKYILLFSCILVTLVFPIKFVVNLYLPKYNESLSILYLLIASQYVSVMVRSVHVNIYKAKQKQNKYFKIMFFIVLLSILLNTIGIIINKSMIIIAIATLITNIIWFIVGEFDLKDYKLKTKDYIYFFTILFLFLITSLINNVFIGFFTYIIISILLSIILERGIIVNVKDNLTNIVKIFGKNR